jgi:hypothetical protein
MDFLLWLSIVFIWWFSWGFCKYLERVEQEVENRKCEIIKRALSSDKGRRALAEALVGCVKK